MCVCCSFGFFRNKCAHTRRITRARNRKCLLFEENNNNWIEIDAYGCWLPLVSGILYYIFISCQSGSKCVMGANRTFLRLINSCGLSFCFVVIISVGSAFRANSHHVRLYCATTSFDRIKRSLSGVPAVHSIFQLRWNEANEWLMMINRHLN